MGRNSTASTETSVDWRAEGDRGGELHRQPQEQRRLRVVEQRRDAFGEAVLIDIFFTQQTRCARS